MLTVKHALTRGQRSRAHGAGEPVCRGGTCRYITGGTGAGWPGVLLHEAVGHGLEGDFNRRGTSVFSGQMGQRVSSELCTVVDDGTMQDRRGSISIDDEGTPGQYNVLIENGVLKGYAGQTQRASDGRCANGQRPS